MATLEVHDGRGGVELATIGREAPALFGADPKCDIIIDDPEALPFHGRIRWKRGRYKVEAFPEARALEVSGKRVVSTVFRQGDELRVGAWRLFMLNPNDGPVDTEKTVVQARPPAATVPPIPGRRTTEEPPRPLERIDWGSIDVAPPSGEIPLADEARSRRRSAEPFSTGTMQAALPSRVEPPPATAGPAWKRLLARFSPEAVAPGQERVASSPLIIGLLLALGLLVLTGVGLWGIIARTTADREFRTAEDSLQDGEFRNAIRQFDRFLAHFPKDRRAGKARVLRALSNVRQFATDAGPIWGNALDAARDMIDAVGKEPAFRDAKADLADLVLKTAGGLADRTKASADAATLKQAEEALALHERLAGEPAATLRERARIPARLDAARAAVIKAQARRDALAAMDAAIKQGSAAGVFAARDGLVERYPDLANDRDVVKRMTDANDLLRKAVTFSPSTRPAATEPRPEPLGPPLSLVLRSDPGAPAPPDGPVVFALADGYAYGLDGTRGAPLWHHPAGLSAPFPPQPVPGDGTAVYVDARSDELVRVDGPTGTLIWRQPLDEPVTAPPLIQGNQLVQATPTGKILFLDLASGELRGTLDLGMPLAQSPVADESGQHLYVLAERSSLFVLTREPPGCAAVEYLGHERGSIGCTPARLGRFLVVPINHKLDSGRWDVFLLEEEAGRPRRVQTVPVAGWTWGTPASAGSIVWSVADRGAVVAYSLSYDAKEPLTAVAQLAAEDRPSGPAFARARGEREVWIASGRSARLDLDVERGKIAAGWSLALAGPARAPIQLANRLAVLTQQWTDGPGIALWGVDPFDGTVEWRTVLGASWPVPPSPSPDRDALTTLAPEGRTLTLSREQLDRGGFITAALPGLARESTTLPPDPFARLDAGSLTVVVPSAGSSRLLVRDGDGPFRSIRLPAALAARPLFWSNDLLIPGVDGRAYLIDPRTGASTAEPYVPPYDRSRPTRWLSPAMLAGDVVALADDAGRVRRLTRARDSRARLESPGEPTDLGRPIVADPASTGGALLVATDDNKVRVLAGRDLSPAGVESLDGGLRLGPVTVLEHGFAGDAAGNVLAFGPDGRSLWTARLGDAPAAGPPVLRDGAAWFLLRDGTLERRALADGAALDRVRLDLLPAGGPLGVGPDLAIPAGRGTLRLRAASPGG